MKKIDPRNIMSVLYEEVKEFNKRHGISFAHAMSFANQGATQVRTGRQGEMVRGISLTIRPATYTRYALTVGQAGGVNVCTEQVAGGRSVYYADPQMTNVNTGIARFLVGNFSLRELKVRYEFEAQRAGDDVREKVVEFTNRPIFYNMKSGVFFWIVQADEAGDGEKKEQHLENMLTHEVADDSEVFNADGSFRNDILAYNYEYVEDEDLQLMRDDGNSNPTAGEAKRFALVYKSINYKGFDPLVCAYGMTYGMSETLRAVYAAMKSKKFAQSNNRKSQPDAPMTPLAYVPCAVISFAKWQRSEEVMDENGKVETINADKHDGQARICASLAKAVLQGALKGIYSFAHAAVEGCTHQFRPWSWKCMGVVQSDTSVHQFRLFEINRRKAEDEKAELEAERAEQRKNILDHGLMMSDDYTVVVYQSDLQQDEDMWWYAQSQFHSYMNGEKSDFSNFDLVIAMDHSVDLNSYIYGDMNAVKAEFDLRMETTYNLMDANHSCKDWKHGASLSTQIMDSLLVFDATAAFDIFVKAVADMMKGKLDGLRNPVAKAPKSKQLDGSVSWSQVVQQVTPWVSSVFYMPFLKAQIKSIFTGMTRRVSRLNATVPGFYCKIEPDWGADYSVELLHTYEDGSVDAYLPDMVNINPDAEGHFHLNIRKEFRDMPYVTGFKFPKEAVREYLKLRPVSGKELWNRVEELYEAGKITLDQRRALKIDIGRTRGGIIYVPAREDIKSQEAGMDYDGDGLIVLLHKKVCKVFSLFRPIAHVIYETWDKFVERK